MTASVTLTEDVLAGFAHASRRSALNLLRNFKKTGDKSGADNAASLSTKIWFDTRTLAASASENLDLAGVLTAFDGSTVTFTKIHGIYIRPADTNTNQVVVGNAASNQFVGPFGAAAHTAAVDAGSTLMFTSKAGWTVTPGTADILKVANSGGGTGVDYDIVIFGE